MADQPLNKPVVSEDEARARAQSLNLPFIRLRDREISRDILKIIPEETARDNQLIAYEKSGNNLKIAVGNPEKLQAKAPEFLTDLKKTQGYNFSIAITLPEDIEHALTFYNLANQPQSTISSPPVLPKVDLKTVKILPETLNKFPKEVAEKYKMICFEVPKEGLIKVGLVNANDPKMREILEFVRKRNGIQTEEYQITEEDFQTALALYDVATDSGKKSEPVAENLPKPTPTISETASPVIKPIPAVLSPNPVISQVAKPVSNKINSDEELDKKAVFLSDKEFELQEREGKIVSEEKRIQASLEKLNLDEKQLNEQKESLVQAQTQLGQELLTLEHNKNDLNRIKGELASLKQETDTQKQIIEQKEKDLQVLERSVDENKKKLEFDFKTFQEDKTQLEEKTVLINEKEKQLSAKESRLAQDSRIVIQQKQRLNALRLELSKQEKIAQKQKEDLIIREGKANKAYELLAYLEKEKAELVEEQAKVFSLKTDLRNLELSRQEFSKDQESFKEQKEKINQAEQFLTDKQAVLTQAQEELANFQQETQKTKDEVVSRQKQLEEEKASFFAKTTAKEQSLAEKEKSVAETQAQLQDLELARQESSKDRENINQEKTALKQKEQEIFEREKKLAESQQFLDQSKAEILAKKEEVDKLTQQIEQEKTAIANRENVSVQDNQELAQAKEQLEKEKATTKVLARQLDEERAKKVEPRQINTSGNSQEVVEIKKQLEQERAELAQKTQQLETEKQNLARRKDVMPPIVTPSPTIIEKIEPKPAIVEEPQSSKQTPPESAQKPWWKMDVKDIPNLLGVNKKSVAQPLAKEVTGEIFQPVESPFWQEETTPENRTEENTAIAAAPVQLAPPVVIKKEAPGQQEPAEIQLSHATVGASSEKVGGLAEENMLDSYFPKGVKNKEELNEIVRSGFVPKLVAGIIYLAAIMKASDIHLEPLEKTLRLRYRVDGMLKNILEIPLQLQPAVVSRIKILCKMKIDENRIPQDGRFGVRVAGRDIDLRVSTFPTAHGEKAELRLLDKSAALLKLEDLGLKGENFKKIQAAITKPYGVVLVTGPTGSGKTTTLYAVLNKLSRPSVNIVTLEDPVEYDIAGINQCQVNPRIGFTFAEGLRSILRQDPNIIMVGEIRDKETAELATHAALTGHLVLSTLHTNDAAGALPRLIDMGIEPFLITSSINAIIAQRLVRRLCPKCRVEDNVPAAILEKVKQEMSAATSPDLLPWKGKPLKFYKSKGCPDCAEGYKGRMAIYEVLSMTPELEEMTINHKTSDELFLQAHKEGMSSLREDGILKALEGLTTLDEVFRVTETS